MPSKLEQLQQQYRRQLLQEKEERLIKIHTESQQKALSKVSRYTNNGSNATGISPTSSSSVPKIVNSNSSTSTHHASPVKKGSPGVDRSRPLPPISKDGRNSNNRTSPVSAPADNKATAGVYSNGNSTRSRSVDLADSPRTGPPSKSHQQQLRNGYPSRTTQEYSSRQEQSVEYEQKRTDQETLSRLRQAELQRLRAKVRDETPPRSNGFTGAISKSSNGVPKKPSPAKPQPTTVAAAPNRTRPSYQGATTAPPRRQPASTNKAPVARGGAGDSSTRNGAVARKPPGPGQEQCRICGRNFNSDRIEKHVSICSKAAQKKVKVFDATKMRVKGTEAEQFVRKGLASKPEPKPNKSDWRKKRNDFIEAIRQAKLVQQHLAKGGKVSDLPPPPPSDTSDYIPCPYCGRKFSPAVADRHIPKCKNILSNKKNPASRKK